MVFVKDISHPICTVRVVLPHGGLSGGFVSAYRLRHRALQKLFWNRIGAALARLVAAFEIRFETVVRNHSLISTTNGERWLPTLLGPEPVVFDVGFHDGESAREILKLRPKAQIFGFDPSRFAARCHAGMFRDDPRVAFANVALSDAPGELPFHDYENMCNSLAARKEMPGATPERYLVPVTTLDAFCAARGVDHVDLLKIDAEGFDLAVLEGGRDFLLRQGADMFVFEFASGWSASKRYLWEAVEFIDPLPYRLFRLFNGFLQPFSYRIEIDSCTTRPGMYVGVSEGRLARGDIPIRDYGL